MKFILFIVFVFRFNLSGLLGIRDDRVKERDERRRYDYYADIRELDGRYHDRAGVEGADVTGCNDESGEQHIEDVDIEAGESEIEDSKRHVVGRECEEFDDGCKGDIRDREQ